ncbi:unnamed protein product [Adineta ricciae]|uniref:Uncharacterized protein n=1 Tax=Adineta ricciae TaxID=249248 RepID=A0A813XIF7_ADIRI|nr:unnamed protein product [Adineta ricciae]
MGKNMFLLIALMACLLEIGLTTFDLQWHNFDAFGNKLTANDYLVRRSICLIDHPGLCTLDVNLIYHLAAGKQTNDSDSSSMIVVFVGEDYTSTDTSSKAASPARQSSLMNWDADVVKSKYLISVSIGSDSNQAIVGVQIINAVFRFEYIVSVIIHITKHSGQFRYTSKGINPIGGFRTSIKGQADEGNTVNDYAVQELQCSSSLHRYVEASSQSCTIKLELTRVTNVTEFLRVGDEHRFAGLWLLLMKNSIDGIFHERSKAQTYAFFAMTLTLVMSTESLLYIVNQQTPIARSNEIIFHDRLFTIFCLELFGLLYLSIKLLYMSL